MMEPIETSDGNKTFDLSRFIRPQELVYPNVLSELKAGRKRTHWMWFIFPQVAGLGYSAASKFYAISGLEEAKAYLAHPVLGTRLRECTEAVLAIEGRSVSEIFGSPDDVKLKSSMTLFAQVSEPNSVFVRVLEKYFHSNPDAKTLQLLTSLK